MSSCKYTWLQFLFVIVYKILYSLSVFSFVLSLENCLFQATGRYEEAAEAYREELQSNVPSAEHRAFIAQQTLDCYLHLAGKTHKRQRIVF